MSYRVILPTGAQRGFSSPLDAVTYAVTTSGNMHPHHAYLQSLKNAVAAGGTITIDGITVMKLSESSTQVSNQTTTSPIKSVLFAIGILYLGYLMLFTQ